MKPSYAALGLAAVLSILAVLWGVSEWRQRSGSQAEVQANIESGVASANQTQAQASDALVSNLQAKVDGQQQDLDRVSKERDALLRKLASKPVPGANPADSVPGTDAMDALEAAVAIRDEVIAKDAEVIDSQKVIIDSQVGVISQLTLSRDSWKATAEARERQAMAQEAATRAWKKAVTSSKWVGRAQGFAAGIALGYVGGRR
jgi:hypothetical protein